MKLHLLPVSTVLLTTLALGTFSPFKATPLSCGPAPSTIAQTKQHTTNPFGALIGKSDDKNIGVAASIKIARNMGVQYLRTRIWISEWDGSSPACDEIAASGIKMVLNINWAPPVGHKAIPYPTDTALYRKKVTEILTKYKPALVSVENEEDNPLYHSGSPQDYVNQLKIATEVAHKMGLKISDGGLTSTLVALMVYEDYMKTGNKQAADAFVSKTIPDGRIANVPKMIQHNAKMELAHQVLKAVKDFNMDYINFHWYAPIRGLKGQDISKKMDPNVLTDIVNYLHKETGKPVITTEIGQLDPSPGIVTGLMQKALELKMPYFIWYSADGGEGKAIALQNGDGSLRENGVAFKNFISEHIK